jgi:hypothetical protein
MTRRRALQVALILAVAALFLGTDARVGVGQCPEAPPYRLLPATWPCPVLPTCGTQYGVCRLPYFAIAGQPCQCQAADGTWIPGVCTRGSTR